jgi:hypothetical protein
MTDTQSDWTGWLIGALGTMTLAVAGLGKFIAALYAGRIVQLEQQGIADRKKYDDYIIFADNRAHEITAKHEECMELHHLANIEIAKLKAYQDRDKGQIS